MQRAALLASLLLLLPLNAWAAPAKYYVPPTRMNVGFKIAGEAKDQTLSGVFGDATGAFAYDDETEELSRLRIAINARSLKASTPKTQARAEALFGAALAPEITLAMPSPTALKDGSGKLKASLSVGGQTKSVIVEATLSDTGTGRRKALLLQSSFTRDQFGMTDEVANTDEKPLGDTVSLSLEMQAIGQ